MKTAVELFNIISGVLVELQEPTFVRDFVFNYTEGGKNLERNGRVRTKLNEVVAVVERYEEELRKLLGSKASPVSKQHFLDSIIKMQTELLEQMTDSFFSTIFKSTPLGLPIITAYDAECERYRNFLVELIGNSRALTEKYRLSISVSPDEYHEKKANIRIPHKIGWNTSKQKISDFFDPLIQKKTITLPNDRTNSKEIHKVLAEVFEQAKKSNSKINLSNVEITSTLKWNLNMEEFTREFGALLQHEILFLNQPRGDVNPIGRVLFKVFEIRKRIGQEWHEVGEDAFLSALRRHSTKK
jgi:hypothetical protein